MITGETGKKTAGLKDGEVTTRMEMRVTVSEPTEHDVNRSCEGLEEILT